MIQIFDELDFVTIDNGVMTVNKEAEKRETIENILFRWSAASSSTIS